MAWRISHAINEEPHKKSRKTKALATAVIAQKIMPLQMMQKQMSLDEFREEKIEDKIVKMNLQVLNRMALLENKIT